MHSIRNFLTAGVFALSCGVTAAHAQEVRVTLNNLDNQSEPGSGAALVNLSEGTVEVEVTGLQPVPHDNPLGSGRILGYAAWLVNSEQGPQKINLGFFFPVGDTGSVSFQANGRILRGSNFTPILTAGGDLSSFGFNTVVITGETKLDLNLPQPSGVPIAAGHIPLTPEPSGPLPAVEVFMGALDEDVFGFQQETVTIFAGQSIRWTNVSPAFVLPHTVTRTDADGPFPGAGPEFDSGFVPFGQSFTRTFTLPPGFPATVFNYHCTSHTTPLDLGMRGRVVVVAQPTSCTANLTGDQEVPPVTTSARGSATLTLNPTLMTLIYTVTTRGLSGVAAHIHQAPAGVIGDVIHPLVGGPSVWSGTTEPLTPEQVTALTSGGLYVNVHTAANPGGEIRGQISCSQ
jgi:plastocyanin